MRTAVVQALAEDLGALGDVTSALLPPGLEATGLIVARSRGVMAGRLAVSETLARVDPTLQAAWSADDGAEVGRGAALARVRGPLASLLTAERTALNFLGRLSGVATLTRRYVRAAGGTVAIWDTRKTTPGLRALEKAAVRAGGGANHRDDLSACVFLKDNHLAVLGIAEAVGEARRRWPGLAVEVEADRPDQAAEAMAAGADVVLLDNMALDDVRRCVSARGRASHPLLEVSGGVGLDDVAAYAATGVDRISVGALTHSAPTLDVGLDIER